jgi:hypothetical protein
MRPGQVEARVCAEPRTEDHLGPQLEPQPRYGVGIGPVLQQRAAPARWGSLWFSSWQRGGRAGCCPHRDRVLREAARRREPAGRCRGSGRGDLDIQLGHGSVRGLQPYRKPDA